MKFKSIRYVSAVTMVLLGLTLVFACNVQAKTITLVIGSGWTKLPSGWPDLGHMIKKRVEAKTEHKINLVEAYGGTIAKPGEGLNAVRDGMLNMGWVVWPFSPNELFLHNFGYSAPFTTKDPVLAYKVGRQMLDEVPYLKNVFEKKHNQKLLTCMSHGGYQLFTTFPVKTVDDLKNKKIGGAGPNLDWMRAVGAVPVQSPIMEAYTSIQTGVYDGYIASVPVCMMGRLQEVISDLIMCDLGDFIMTSINVNLDYWNKLPPEVQNVILEVSEDFNRANAMYTKTFVENSVETMSKNGVKCTELPFEEKRRWADSMDNYAERFIKEAEKKKLPGKELLEKYISALEKEGYVFPREWVKP